MCNDVEIEPLLIPLSNEKFSKKMANTSDDARLDVSARGFWIRGKKAFIDVRVFNPIAKSYMKTNPSSKDTHSALKSAYRVNELKKKREYNERILQVEHGTFTPLVFSTFGGIGYEGSRFLKRLNMLISAKRNDLESTTMGVIRIKFSFSLLRTTLLCIRGSRSRKGNSIHISDIDFTVAKEEAMIK